MPTLLRESPPTSPSSTLTGTGQADVVFAEETTKVPGLGLQNHDRRNHDTDWALCGPSQTASQTWGPSDLALLEVNVRSVSGPELLSLQGSHGSKTDSALRTLPLSLTGNLSLHIRKGEQPSAATCTEFQFIL